MGIAIFFVLISCVLSFIALVRTGSGSNIYRRMGLLERELEKLRKRVAEAPPIPPTPQPASIQAELVIQKTEITVAVPLPGVVLPETAPSEPPLASEFPPDRIVPPPPQAPRPPSAAPKSRIEWERWIGVRGAAVIGGIVLALAGILFFQYSVEHGLISPALRVVLGTLMGLFCIGGSEWLRRKNYDAGANAAAGAGIVILYAAFWAAKARYNLIGMEVAFLLMILVTVTCCLLCLRHASKFIALLGLAGGFATPLMLHGDVDRPFGLFGYVLILDLAFLWIAQKKGWSILALLSLLATVFIEALWIGAKLDDRLWLGMGILAVFALVYAVVGQTKSVQGKKMWWVSQAGAILFPFAFAIYFAVGAKFGPRLYPLGGFLILLDLAAAWISHRQKKYLLSLGAASATLAVLFAWAVSHTLSASGAWEFVVVSFGVAFVFHLLTEFQREKFQWWGSAPVALLTVSGVFFLLLLRFRIYEHLLPWPWWLGFLALAALLYRQAQFPSRGWLMVLATTLLGIGFGVSLDLIFFQAGEQILGLSWYLAIPLAVAVILQGYALSPLNSDQDMAEHAAALFPLWVLVILMEPAGFLNLRPDLFLAVTLALGILTALAATRLASGAWYISAVVITAITHSIWTYGFFYYVAERTEVQNIYLCLQGAAVLFFTFWPFIAAKRLKTAHLVWVGAALAGPLWFLSLKQLFVHRYGTGFIGVLPVTLGILSMAAASRVHKIWKQDEKLHKSALVWFSAVTLGFLSVAIPLQLDKEWITMGWALEGFAVMVLWKRLDHAGLKYFGMLLFGLVVTRLFFYYDIFDYYPRPAWRICNWIMYTYLVPAACLVGSAYLLSPLESQRARSWEKSICGKYPVASLLCGFSAIIVIFIWINLAIADWFSTQSEWGISFERQPARDLTTSIAWAIYAVILLILGMLRNRSGLRWFSLVFLVVTIGKVFLYDLGQLQDLYRVLSLLGLAASLILVSLLYQRFVFRKTKTVEGTT